MGNAEPKINDDNESFLDELAPGSELLQGQFKIVQFLNSGGFGITYLAVDSLDRKVVIKECFPSSFCNRSRTIVQARSRAHTAELRSVVQLFVQEARSLAKLNHPNIVGVHQVFEDNETAYMVLDFVEGRDLLDTLEDDDHGLTAPQIKGILKDVLGAVQFIHDQDILHRDISPDNILIDADLRPVLIDFGAAREEATKKSRVLSAMRVVKDGYSPQEFYVQGSEQTPSSDLYALGATFYHLIAGEIPPNSQARLAAIASGEKDPYEALAGRIKGYDSKFLGAIDTALGILPKDRMQSATDWLNAMEGNRRKSRVVTQQVPLSSAAAASQEPKRSALVPLLGSVAVVALLAVGGLAVTGQLASFNADDVAGASAPEVAQPAATPIVSEAPVATDAPAVADASVVEEGAPVEAEAPAVQTVDVAPVSPAETDVAPAVVAEAAPVVVETVEPSAEVPAPVAPTAPVIAEADPAQAESIAAPVETAEGVSVTPPAVETEAPVDVVEAPAEPVVPDAPQPEVVQETQAPVLTAKASPAPSVIAEVEPTLRPRLRPEVRVQEPVAQDGIAGVAAAAAALAPPPPVVVAEVDTSVFTKRVLFNLPFEGVTDSNVISKAADVAPIWVRPGTRVLAVNDLEVERISDIGSLLSKLDPTADVDSLPVSFTVKAEGEESAVVNPWVVAVRHETVLPDGATFVTSKVNGAWQTVITKTSGNTGELEVGDIIVAYVPTSEPITDHTVLHDILERERANGTSQLNFAVTRDGSMWVVAMTYAEGA